jgi:hypothetical protein
MTVVSFDPAIRARWSANCAAVKRSQRGVPVVVAAPENAFYTAPSWL